MSITTSRPLCASQSPKPEDQRAVYGLTKNIDTFNPGRIVTHEYADMLRDVARATSWGERLSYVLRGPGWATRHRAGLAAAAPGTNRTEAVE